MLARAGLLELRARHPPLEHELLGGNRVFRSRARRSRLGATHHAYLQTREVGQVLQRVVRRIDKHLRRHGLLEGFEPNAELEDPEDQLAASAVSGQAPPAGPQWRRGLAPLPAATLGYDKPLCASLAGFTLHAATRAGALDTAGRERLLRYVLRPRMKLVALVTQPKSIVRYLAKLGEPIDVPTRSTSRGPPYWKSTVLRRKAGA